MRWLRESWRIDVKRESRYDRKEMIAWFEVG